MMKKTTSRRDGQTPPNYYMANAAQENMQCLEQRAKELLRNNEASLNRIVELLK